jgi:hypothetical protein
VSGSSIEKLALVDSLRDNTHLTDIARRISLHKITYSAQFNVCFLIASASSWGSFFMAYNFVLIFPLVLILACETTGATCAIRYSSFLWISSGSILWSLREGSKKNSRPVGVPRSWYLSLGLAQMKANVFVHLRMRYPTLSPLSPVSPVSPTLTLAQYLMPVWVSGRIENWLRIVCGSSTAERTGSHVIHNLWSYVLDTTWKDKIWWQCCFIARWEGKEPGITLR